jgi:phosphotransferase system  glucose/maltose/N-acetylglucosamine-specific IIC component
MIEGDLLQRAAAGAAGSGLAVWFAKVSGADIVVMFLGGLIVSIIFGEPVANYLSLQKYEAAVGFSIGFLSIMVLRKIYEGLHSIDGASVAKALVDKLRKMLGV